MKIKVGSPLKGLRRALKMRRFRFSKEGMRIGWANHFLKGGFIKAHVVGTRGARFHVIATLALTAAVWGLWVFGGMDKPQTWQAIALSFLIGGLLPAALFTFLDVERLHQMWTLKRKARPAAMHVAESQSLGEAEQVARYAMMLDDAIPNGAMVGHVMLAMVLLMEKQAARVAGHSDDPKLAGCLVLEQLMQVRTELHQTSNAMKADEANKLLAGALTKGGNDGK